jgi:spore maturation protein CgeB
MDGKSIETQPLRYLWAYSAGDDWTRDWHQRLLARRRERGFNVKGFCVTPPSVGGAWFPFPELDHGWRTGNPALMQMYAELTEQLQDRDVLILYNGANLHPEFVSWLKVLKVYTAGDDPESTEILTRPIAPAFDIHLVNNVACVDMYRAWGLKRVHFWPLGSLMTEEDVSDLSEEQIMDISGRPLPVAFFGDRNDLRKERLDRLTDAFPEAFCAGRGWPRGKVDWDEMWSVYRRAQTGWNLHNSTGPINFRLYDLAAHGVMQICDNKSHLSQVYDEAREAVGFDTIGECIELTRYYLAHPEEQREIALAGWRRWRRDYTPDRVWDKLTKAVESHLAEFSLPIVEEVSAVKMKLQRQARRAAVHRRAQRVLNSLRYRGGLLRDKLFRG